MSSGSELSVSSKKRIFYLDIARCIAIISITMNHAVNRSFEVESGTLAEYLAIPVWLSAVKAVIMAFSRLGVPLFLMISGALLLPRDYSGDGLKRFIKHNWLQLVITTEIWYAIMFWYRMFIYSAEFTKWTMAEKLFQFVKTLFFINPVTMANMWYMPMIICVYLMIPVLSVALKKLRPQYFLLPMGIVVLGRMILPDMEAAIGALGINRTMSLALSQANIFSMYAVYILLGYFIAELDVFKKLKTYTVSILAACAFVCYSGFQFWIFTRDYDYVVGVGYTSFFPMISSVLLFELLRRSKEREHRAATRLAEISFGIYFIHICIMEGLVVLIGNRGWDLVYLNRFFVLELVSFLGSVLIILIFEKNKWIAKNMFGIKR